ncbi:hypothetical protein ACUY2S_10365 [Corynebacterium parakroppenstedtii]
MNHDNDPKDPEEHVSDQHGPNSTDQTSRKRSAPKKRNSDISGLQQDGSSHPETNRSDLPGIPTVGPAHLEMAQYSGPTPHSSEIKQLNAIEPGLGTRVMNDAHDDMIQDRELTKASFDYAIWEARRRFCVATLITLLSFAGIFISLFFLAPPESITGAIVCGLGTVGPVVRSFLDIRDKGTQENKEPAENGDAEQDT